MKHFNRQQNRGLNEELPANDKTFHNHTFLFKDLYSYKIYRYSRNDHGRDSQVTDPKDSATPETLCQQELRFNRRAFVTFSFKLVFVCFFFSFLYLKETHFALIVRSYNQETNCTNHG